MVAFVTVANPTPRRVEKRSEDEASVEKRREVVALVVLRFVAKKFVLVAFVDVEVRLVMLRMVEDACAMSPLEKVRSEVVALFGNGYAKFA